MWTEADVERVLHECKRDPLLERVYSIDDIAIGWDTTPAAAAACGIHGTVSGGNLTIDQASGLQHQQAPPANKAPPLRMALKQGNSALHSRPPAKKEYLWKQ